MTSSPTISVVTPSFNQASFLAETIESVLNQEGDFGIDYIVVDGASTDGSVEVIRRYQQLLDDGRWPVKCRAIRYRWRSESDEGQGDAIMKGFAMAEGEILAWLNSDDIYLPGALQSAAEAFDDDRDLGLLYGDADYCDTAGGVIGKYRTGNFDFQKLAWFNFICQPSAFMSRAAFSAVGGVDTTLHFAMDYDLWVRIGRAFPCRYLPKTLSRYRLHDDSKTVRPETLFENSEEALRLAVKHFDWAPLTRVYNSSRSYCAARLPSWLAGSRIMLAVAAVIHAILRSLWLNRGVRAADLKLLRVANFRNLFRSRLEIMTGKSG